MLTKEEPFGAGEGGGGGLVSMCGKKNTWNIVQVLNEIFKLPSMLHHAMSIHDVNILFFFCCCFFNKYIL